ncbi:hypothetical protein ACOMHN_047307 [Nucella lapillus]
MGWLRLRRYKAVFRLGVVTYFLILLGLTAGWTYFYRHFSSAWGPVVEDNGHYPGHHHVRIQDIAPRDDDIFVLRGTRDPHVRPPVFSRVSYPSNHSHPVKDVPPEADRLPSGAKGPSGSCSVVRQVEALSTVFTSCPFVCPLQVEALSTVFTSCPFVCPLQVEALSTVFTSCPFVCPLQVEALSTVFTSCPFVCPLQVEALSTVFTSCPFVCPLQVEALSTVFTSCPFVCPLQVEALSTVFTSCPFVCPLQVEALSTVFTSCPFVCPLQVEGGPVHCRHNVCLFVCPPQVEFFGQSLRLEGEPLCSWLTKPKVLADHRLVLYGDKMALLYDVTVDPAALGPGPRGGERMEKVWGQSEAAEYLKLKVATQYFAPPSSV